MPDLLLRQCLGLRQNLRLCGNLLVFDLKLVALLRQAQVEVSDALFQGVLNGRRGRLRHGELRLQRILCLL